VDAGNPGSGEELGEAAFGTGGIERNSVQVQLVAVGPQKDAGASLIANGDAELSPGGLELSGSAGMPELVEPGKLQQNIQTAHECAGCGGFGVGGHTVREVARKSLVALIRYLYPVPIGNSTAGTRVANPARSAALQEEAKTPRSGEDRPFPAKFLAVEGCASSAMMPAAVLLPSSPKRGTTGDGEPGALL
jgi:hypothetical protein